MSIQSMVVIDESVPIVLNPDVRLEREGDRRPRVRFELGAVHEEVRPGDGAARELFALADIERRHPPALESPSPQSASSRCREILRTAGLPDET